jgi:hypothetical protein
MLKFYKSFEEADWEVIYHKNITLKGLKRIYRFFKTLDEFTEKVEFPIKPKVFYRGLPIISRLKMY